MIGTAKKDHFNFFLLQMKHKNFYTSSAAAITVSDFDFGSIFVPELTVKLLATPLIRDNFSSTKQMTQ